MITMKDCEACRRCANVLVGLKEEAKVLVVDNWASLVLLNLFRGQLHVCVDPGLTTVSEVLRFFAQRLTFEQHWSSRSTNTGDHAPAARMTRSARYSVPSFATAPTQVLPSSERRRLSNAPDLGSVNDARRAYIRGDPLSKTELHAKLR